MKMIENIRENLPIIPHRAMASAEVSELEGILEAALVPVTPRAEFVERLNRQLIVSAPLARKRTAKHSAPVLQYDIKSRETLLIGAATVIGAAAIFATGFRVALTLLGLIGFLIQLGSKKPDEKHPPAQSTV